MGKKRSKGSSKQARNPLLWFIGLFSVMLLGLLSSYILVTTHATTGVLGKETRRIENTTTRKAGQAVQNATITTSAIDEAVNTVLQDSTIDMQIVNEGSEQSYFTAEGQTMTSLGSTNYQEGL